MAFSNPALEKRLQTIGGNKPQITGSLVKTTPTQAPTPRVTGFSNPALEKRIQTIASTPTKKVSATPVKVVSAPKKQPTLLDNASAFLAKIPAPAGIPQAVFGAVKGLDFERLKSAITAGAKTIPGTTKIAGGIIAENWAKQQKQMNSFFGILPKQFEPLFGNKLADLATEPVANKAIVEAPRLREQGQISQKKAIAPYAKLGPAKGNTQKIAEAVVFNLPQMALSTGLTVATSLLTKNPQLATAVGMSTSYGMGASEIYNTARENGLTDKQALPYATIGGAVVGALDFVPLNRLIGKTTGASKVIEQSIIKKITSEIFSVGTQAGFEGITEGLQEIVGNAIESTYKEHTDLFKNVGLSTVVGALLGGGTDIALNTALHIGNLKGESVEQVSDKVNKKIETILNKPEAKRTAEEKLIVESVLTTQVSPDEALGIVTDGKFEKTDQGKEIVKSVLQAKQEGMDLRITTDDGHDIVKVEMVSPNYIRPVTIPEDIPQDSSNQEILYHGTDKQFDTFDLEKAGTRNSGDQGFAGKGIYLTNSKEVAGTFAEGKDIYRTENPTGRPRIVESTLNPNIKILEVNNFKEMYDALGIDGTKSLAEKYPDPVKRAEARKKQANQIKEKAQAMGYGAIKVDGGGIDKNGIKTYEIVVFDPKDIQIIKSSDKKGFTDSSTFEYTPAKNLTPEEQKVETNLGNKISSNYDAVVNEYQSKFGNVLNTDNARELSQDYAATNDTRSKYSAAVHEPASQLVKNIYTKMLAEPAPEGKLNAVLFTGGGTGAGKSSGLNNLVDANNYQIVYDANSNRIDSAKEKIDQALAAGKEVDVVYVYRDPVEALQNGALPRAMRMGRTVPIDEHIKTHLGAAETIVKLAEAYKGDDRVQIQVIDNSLGKGNQKLSDIDVFKKTVYDKGELKNKLLQVLKQEYESGRISKQVYEGTIGNKVESQGTSTQNSASNGEQSQEAQVAENPQGSRKNIVSTKESKAIKDNLVSKFLEVGQTSEDATDYKKNIQEAINNALEKAKNDKVVLSAIRAAIGDELIRISGASPTDSYKAQYAQIRQAATDEFMGPAIEFIEQTKADIDEKLITAREVPAVVEKIKDGSKVVVKPANETPIGTNIQKDSRLYKRISDVAEGAIKEELDSRSVTYNTLDLEKQKKIVTDLITESPEKAIDMAKGLINTPEGVTRNAISMGLYEAAREADTNLSASLLTDTSLRSTRAGQEIVSLRGDATANPSLTAARKVISSRIDSVVKRYNDTIKGLGVAEDAPAIKKLDALVKHEAQKVKKIVTEQQKRIQSAQDIINQLTCK